MVAREKRRKTKWKKLYAKTYRQKRKSGRKKTGKVARSEVGIEWRVAKGARNGKKIATRSKCHHRAKSHYYISASLSHNSPASLLPLSCLSRLLNFSSLSSRPTRFGNCQAARRRRTKRNQDKRQNNTIITLTWTDPNWIKNPLAMIVEFLPITITEAAVSHLNK